ncbi:MAG: hypothetical protein A7316_06720 [Candidatus Altiarchaeales archaeon WOR_SM1_86-2]|nr:MAG: hypothetical protein A7316_06720 [Candidatus Altiarchaeales archaeon WOR_SM1_86-2]
MGRVEAGNRFFLFCKFLRAQILKMNGIFYLYLNKIINNNKMTVTTLKVNKEILPVLHGLSRELEIGLGDELLVLESRDSVVLKKVYAAKTFSEMVRPIREKIKKQGITRMDVENAIAEVRG